MNAKVRYWTRWCHIRYEASKRFERAEMAFIWKLPRRFVKRCAIRVIANATTGEYSNQIVPELTACDALARWSS